MRSEDVEEEEEGRGERDIFFISSLAMLMTGGATRSGKRQRVSFAREGSRWPGLGWPVLGAAAGVDWLCRVQLDDGQRPKGHEKKKRRRDREGSSRRKRI